MNAVVGANHHRSRAAASPGTQGSDGGNVDDTQKRLGLLEKAVTEIRAILPFLATKEDVQNVRAELGAQIQSVKGELGVQIQAVEGRLGKEIQSVRADMNATETRILRWMVTTAITCAALAFSIAKFVH